jgi:hypothetical protein
MRKATRVLAAALGFFAGIGGPEHGYFEIKQGNVRPEGLMIASMGPPCDPEAIWNACEPAMTVIPSFLITGIVTTLLGILTMIWSAGFISKKRGAFHEKRGNLGLILLSIALLLTGGGIFPPVIGLVGGIVAASVNKPISRQLRGVRAKVSKVFASLWSWTLVAFFVFLFGQFPAGYFFNDLMLQSGYVIPLIILGLMGLAIVSATAYDVQSAQTSSNQASGDA